MGLKWEEVVGYGVSFFAWLCGYIPTTCVGWTHLFAVITVFITLFFITIPKAWGLHTDRRQKRKNKKRRKGDER